MAEAVATPEMTATQRKYLVYLVMRKHHQMRFGELLDTRKPLEKTVKTLYCSLCGKWVRGKSRMCTAGHLTCGPHGALIPRCPLETQGSAERGPVTEYGIACGKNFCTAHPVFVKIFYDVARLVHQTKGLGMGEPSTKEEEIDMRRRFLGVEDEYLEKLIEWGKEMEAEIVADKIAEAKKKKAATKAAAAAEKALGEQNGEAVEDKKAEKKKKKAAAAAESLREQNGEVAEDKKAVKKNKKAAAASAAESLGEQIGQV